MIAGRRLIPTLAVAATVAAGTSMSTTHLEPAAPKGAAKSQSTSLPDRLPIYDPPQPTHQVVEIPPTTLELAIRDSRYLFSSTLSSAQSSLQSLVSSWIAVERRFSLAIQSVKSPDERLMPASLYVITSAFAGSFLVRNRSIVARFLVPPTFFIGSAVYLLPYTSTNMYNLVFRNLPLEARQGITDVVEATTEKVQVAQRKVAEVQGKARELSTGLKRDVQGLVPKLGEQLPSTEQVVKKVEGMYSTRGKPGVKEVIEEDRKQEK